MKTVTHRKSDTNAKPFITSKFSSKAMASRWQRAITTLDGVCLHVENLVKIVHLQSGTTYIILGFCCILFMLVCKGRRVIQ